MVQASQLSNKEHNCGTLTNHNSEKVSSQEFAFVHAHYDDEKVSENPVMKSLLANCCSLSPKFNELT